MTSVDSIKSAVDELAAEQLHAQFPRDVTAADALPHVDEPLARQWLLANTYGHALLIEIVEKQFNEDTSRDVFASLLNAMATPESITPIHHAHVGRKLVAAFKQHIAEDLAYDANEAIKNYEPTDSELDRVGDPLAAEARSFVRRVNASLAAWRVMP